MPSTIEGQQAFDPIYRKDALSRPRRAPAVAVERNRDGDGHRDDATVLADLEVVVSDNHPDR
jgi:hypothetical protein